MTRSKTFISVFIIILAGVFVYGLMRQVNVLRRIVERMSADSRVAEVVVTASVHDPATGKTATTVKFLEYDADGKPLEPRVYSFPVDVIHFEALVIRFDDIFVRAGHPFKGKSLYLFTKAFALDGRRATVYDIVTMNEIPGGYSVGRTRGWFARALWRKFWAYALDARERSASGVKNAQIEAPGTRFIPGLIYTLKIEHDGGLRIDSRPIPDVLR